MKAEGGAEKIGWGAGLSGYLLGSADEPGFPVCWGGVVGVSLLHDDLSSAFLFVCSEWVGRFGGRLD